MSTAKSVAIVTGASQGIGRATALRLARDFSAVALVARDRKKLEEAATDVRSTGAEAMIFDLDLRLAESAEIAIKGVLELFARIDALARCEMDDWRGRANGWRGDQEYLAPTRGRK